MSRRPPRTPMGSVSAPVLRSPNSKSAPFSAGGHLPGPRVSRRAPGRFSVGSNFGNTRFLAPVLRNAHRPSSLDVSWPNFALFDSGEGFSTRVFLGERIFFRIVRCCFFIIILIVSFDKVLYLICITIFYLI